MNSITLACLLTLAALVAAKPADHYTDRFDNIDLDELLQNRRLLIPYLKCLLDKGRCAPDAKELKEHLREALENNCEKCTEKQREGTRKVIKHLINHEDDYWRELTAKYDPEKKYVGKYENELTDVMA